MGNLAERDFGPDDVKTQLEILAKDFPTLSVKIHCGGDYESAKAIATVTLENGAAIVGPPEIDEIPPLSETNMANNFRRQMFGF